MKTNFVVGNNNGGTSETPAFISKMKICISDKTNLETVFNLILEHDFKMPLKSYIRLKYNPRERLGKGRVKHYVLVPNQHQGYFKQLEVIGNKRSQWHVIKFDVSKLKNLKKILKKRNITLKFICTIRNPYDILATMRRYNDKGSLPLFCKRNIQIIKNFNPQDIFIARHEDMVTNPRSQLAKICDFLQVPATPDYLDNCAFVVNKEPHKSRLKHDWTADEKQTVKSLIEKYDFFSGYDWDT